MPPSSLGPIQPNYNLRVRSDGNVEIYERWHVTGIPAGSPKNALPALPGLGKAHPDFPNATVKYHQLLEIIDGTQMIFAVVYSSVVNGFLIGSVQRLSKANKAVPEPFRVERFKRYQFSNNREAWGFIEPYYYPRLRRYRVEVRIIRGIPIENLQNTIDQNIDKYWVPGSGSNAPWYRFIDGSIVTQGYEELRVEYQFVVDAKVPAFVANTDTAIGSDVSMPALAPNQDYSIKYNVTTGGITMPEISVKGLGVNEFVNLPKLNG